MLNVAVMGMAEKVQNSSFCFKQSRCFLLHTFRQFLCLIEYLFFFFVFVYKEGKYLLNTGWNSFQEHLVMVKNAGLRGIIWIIYILAIILFIQSLNIIGKNKNGYLCSFSSVIFLGLF